MTIERITIEHYKSIRKCALELRDINLLIGQNGSGKTNILSALRYFYDNLIGMTQDTNAFDANNKFSNQFKIAVTYNLKAVKIISQAQLKRGGGRYEAYYRQITGFDDIVTVELSKIKGEQIRWNYNFRERTILYNLFPLCYLDARNVNLTDWQDLWTQIGSLIRFEHSQNKEFQREFKEVIRQGKYNREQFFAELEVFFEKVDLKIKPYTLKRMGGVLSSVYFEGSEFYHKEKALAYSSNGTNLYNYTRLLLKILGMLSARKLLFPTIVIDEPELSLHHTYIDYLCESFGECEDRLRFLVSTHSPRLMKNILQSDYGNANMFIVRMQEGYTRANRMRLFEARGDQRPRTVITDQHANAYFSSLILAVEGASELEVFQNPYLRMVFPVLRSIDIMMVKSDNVFEEIVSPAKRKYDTPMISVIDMDKVIEKKSGSQNTMVFVGKFDRFSDQHRYDYTACREEDTFLKRRIQAIVRGCRFHNSFPFYSAQDPNYWELNRLIREYLGRRDMIVWSTTIEGMLVNWENMHCFEKFLDLDIKGAANLANLKLEYGKLYNYNEKLNFLRLLCEGKSDLLLSLEQLKRENKSLDPNLKQVLQNNRRGKTSGWISRWLEYYFAETLNIPTYTSQTPRLLKKKLAKEDVRARIRSEIKSDFKELHNLIHKIEHQYKSHR